MNLFSQEDELQKQLQNAADNIVSGISAYLTDMPVEDILFVGQQVLGIADERCLALLSLLVKEYWLDTHSREVKRSKMDLEGIRREIIGMAAHIHQKSKRAGKGPLPVADANGHVIISVSEKDTTPYFFKDMAAMLILFGILITVDDCYADMYEEDVIGYFDDWLSQVDLPF